MRLKPVFSLPSIDEAQIFLLCRPLMKLKPVSPLASMDEAHTSFFSAVH
jgi:hypothetical protein